MNLEILPSENGATIGVLTMRAGKANAINDEWIATIHRLLDEVDAAKPRALVIAGDGKFFSGGLDLRLLINLDRDAMRTYMTTFERLMMRVFEQPRPVIAAVNGHAIAGGCVFALQADRRIGGTGSAVKIGLNETQLGLGLPSVVIEALRAQVPSASLFPIAIEGRIFTMDEAKQLGLVEELVAPDHVVARATEVAHGLAKLSAEALGLVKHAIRAPIAATMRKETHAEAWLDTWFSDAGRRHIQAAVAYLQGAR